jgi:hypothetical protein
MLQSVYNGFGGSFWGACGLTFDPDVTSDKVANRDLRPKAMITPHHVVPISMHPSFSASNVTDLFRASRNPDKGAT